MDTKMVEFFNPEDFKNTTCMQGFEHSKELAAKANAIIIRHGLPVYSRMRDSQWLPWCNNPVQLDTHRAMLINIQPISVSCAMHEPDIIEKTHGEAPLYLWGDKCRHCGIRIVPEWKAK